MVTLPHHRRISRAPYPAFCLICFFILFSPIPSKSQTKWFRYDGNPVLDVGPPGSWDANWAQIDKVVLGDTSKLWYTGYNGKALQIGYALSTDGGFNWVKSPAPVLSPDLGTLEGQVVQHANIIYSPSICKMWYAGGQDKFNILYAFSTNGGITWRKRPKPVLGAGGSWWNSGGAVCVSVIEASTGTYKIWYQAEPAGVIGFAEAKDETTWTIRHDPVFSDPAGGYSFFPRVIHNTQVYEMWYGSVPPPNSRIKYSNSVDGLHWTIHTDNPVLQSGSPQSWENNGVTMGDVVFDGRMYHLWYRGLSGTTWRSGYAVSPEGMSVEVSPSESFVRPGRDTVRITVKANDAKLHFSANIKTPTSNLDDPLKQPGLKILGQTAAMELFDDGAHGDGLPGDGVFANYWVPAKEELFFVDLQLTTHVKDTRNFLMENAAIFTTIGPIKLERFAFLGDSTIHPGDTALVGLTLRNYGSSKVGRDVGASLSSADASITEITEASISYSDIPAGESSTTTTYYRIRVNPYAPMTTDATINVAITSWDLPLWHDSFTLHITPPWWRTTWAYGVYVLAGILVLWRIRLFEKNRQRLKHHMELELVKAEKLREMDQMKSRFFANISHEFRTPLTLIEGPVTQLRSGEYKGNHNDQYDLILRNSQRLLRLVNQLLDLSKIESREMKLHVRQVDIVELVRGIAAAFESMARRKSMKYIEDYPVEPIVGWLDPDAVEKIVTNLLSNAFKFTPEGGEVTLTVWKDVFAADNPPMTASCIRVADTGIGIPDLELPHIFDRFYQVDDSRIREHEGTGIGLALTKDLVELHRGTIDVQSDPGKGSTFTVRLPAGKDHFASEEIVEDGNPVHAGDLAGREEVSPPMDRKETVPSGELAEDPADDSQPLVLIVEDNADMRRYIRSHLENGYRIQEANDGVDGVAGAIETVPDIVVSDVMMPKMDGFQLCEKLKTDERTSHIPVILLTARASRESKIEGLETGADDYITKPFDAGELHVRITNLIEQRRRLREKFRQVGFFNLKEITITSADGRFLNRATAIVQTHISDQSFTTDTFAGEMFMSRMQLHRKMRGLTDLSPGEFVRKMRLERASQLLRHRAGTIAEISYQVGYEDPSRFADAFRSQFGILPSEFMKQQKKL